MVPPHLDDGVITEILHRLPTKEAYRLTAVCRRWRAIVASPTFLCRHLSPRPLPLLNDGPYAVILQPRGRRRKVGYTHLTVVATDPDDESVELDLPLDPKYTSMRRSWTGTPSASKKHRPLDCKLVMDSEDGVEDLLIGDLFSSTEEPDDRVACGGAVCEDEEPAGVLGIGDPPVEEEEVRKAPEEPDDGVARGGAAEERGAEEADDDDDYVAFFERTVPTLDVSMVASHERMLLCRDRRRYFVCDPAANRWLALPPSSFPPTHDTARGFHYHTDPATGRVAFTVVLLVRIAQRRVHVETFSSTTGNWDTKVMGAHGVARCLGGVTSPGIHAGTSFYWLSRRKGRVIRYDAARGRASVLREPPEATGSNARVGRSLGSTGGRLRLCTFDIIDSQSECMMPHDGITGEHGVWLLTVDEAWQRVHQATVDDISVYYFLSLFNHEVPVDFAGAGGGYVILNKSHFVLRYDLETGHKVTPMGIYRNDGTLGAHYDRFHAFPLFRPG
ncbi:hypothetical protein QOZ80_1AG0002530 [Eleusine coracana subsp. coracana]|nr:hypothetical protein QOZ80_1AG0002530 [Eleusine coracana subsp. coracana]